MKYVVIGVATTSSSSLVVVVFCVDFCYFVSFVVKLTD